MCDLACITIGLAPDDDTCLFLVPHALSLVCEGIVPLSRPRVLYPLRSVHLGIYICCCSPYCTHALPIVAILLLQSLLHACMAYHGLCLWSLRCGELTRVTIGLKRKLIDNGTDGRHQRQKPPPSSSSSVVSCSAGEWSWNANRSYMSETMAAKAVGAKVSDYCWCLAAVKNLPDDPAILCPHIGSKDNHGSDHSDMSSPIHVKTLKMREDDGWLSKVQRCVRRRTYTEAESYTSKGNSSNDKGDGPKWQLVELYAGISAFMFAAQCLRQPVSLHSFTELHNSAAQHTEARYNARHLGPTETAQFGEDPVDMATVTFECAPYTPSGLQRFGDDKRAIQAVHSATALVNMAPKVFVLENVKEFYTEDSHPRHGVYSKFVRSMAVRGYELSPPTMLMDSQSGGCIYRTRMFIFGEDIQASYGLPPWVLHPPDLAPLCPAHMLQPLSDIQLPALQVHGTYTRKKAISSATGS